MDAAAGTKRPGFDHARLAVALNGVVDQEVEPAALPFFGIEFREDAIRIVLEEKRIEISLDTYLARVVGPAPSGEALSPDASSTSSTSTRTQTSRSWKASRASSSSRTARWTTT